MSVRIRPARWRQSDVHPPSAVKRHNVILHDLDCAQMLDPFCDGCFARGLGGCGAAESSEHGRWRRAYELVPSDDRS
jgi:hypothetical protein